MKEEWKDIPGYDGWYQVSNKGNFRSWNLYGFNKRRKTPRRLKTFMNNRGYKLVHFRKDNKTKTAIAHRVVAETFIPNPGNKPCVNHKDGDKTNNKVENLEWTTNQENMDHAYENGLVEITRGEDRGKAAKLKAREVREIKVKLKKGVMGKVLAEEYGVSPQNICDIKNGRTWTHISISDSKQSNSITKQIS